MKSHPSMFTEAAHPIYSALFAVGRVVAVAVGVLSVAAFNSPAAHASGPTSSASYTMFEEDYPGSTAIAELDAATKLAELEKAFWICDHAGTLYGVDGTMAVACVAVTDELRQVKFDNDTELLTDWWRLNKVEQHAALEREMTAEAFRGTADTLEFPDSI
jgi:hypothetical protein